MTDALTQRNFALDPDDTQRLANLCGPFDEHLRQIELRLGVEINNRGNVFRVIGEDAAVQSGERVLRNLYAATEHETLNSRVLNLRLSEAGVDALAEKQAEGAQEVVIKVKRGMHHGARPEPGALPARDRDPRHQFRRSGRPAPARPIWPWRARSRRWRPDAYNA